MKLMIASDLHGSAAYTRRLLELYRDTGCQRLVLLGDLLYHGPRNPLPEGYEPPAVAKLLNDMADELLCVRGNCDAEVDQMVLHFPILSDSALLVLDGSRPLTASLRTASGVMPSSSALRAERTASRLRATASACRALVRSSPWACLPAGYRASTARHRASTPSPVAADRG